MIATRPTSGAAPLPSATPSSANQSAKAAPPRASTSLAKRASRSKRRILPGLTVGSMSGLGAAGASLVGKANCPKTGGTPASANIVKLNKTTLQRLDTFRSSLFNLVQSSKQSYNAGPGVG